MAALCKAPTKSTGISLSITAVCKNAGKKMLGQDNFFVVPRQKPTKSQSTKSWQKPQQPPWQNQLAKSQQIHSNHNNQYNLQNYNISIATITTNTTYKITTTP